MGNHGLEEVVREQSREQDVEARVRKAAHCRVGELGKGKDV